MLRALNPKTVADPIGTYSHAIEIPPNARWLYISGQVGVRPDGTIPESFTEQAEIVWTNITNILAAAGMEAKDLVKITNYFTTLAHFKDYIAIRSRHLGAARPASTGLVIDALVRPELMLEVEAVAAKA